MKRVTLNVLDYNSENAVLFWLYLLFLLRTWENRPGSEDSPFISSEAEH